MLFSNFIEKDTSPPLTAPSRYMTIGTPDFDCASSASCSITFLEASKALGDSLVVVKFPLILAWRISLTGCTGTLQMLWVWIFHTNLTYPGMLRAASRWLVTDKIGLLWLTRGRVLFFETRYFYKLSTPHWFNLWIKLLTCSSRDSEVTNFSSMLALQTAFSRLNVIKENL